MSATGRLKVSKNVNAGVRLSHAQTVFDRGFGPVNYLVSPCWVLSKPIEVSCIFRTKSPNSVRLMSVLRVFGSNVCSHFGFTQNWARKLLRANYFPKRNGAHITHSELHISTCSSSKYIWNSYEHKWDKLLETHIKQSEVHCSQQRTSRDTHQAHIDQLKLHK